MFKKIQRYILDKKQVRSLAVLTALYFIVEIIINFSIYRQLSISNDRYTAETMEFWGKGIAGIGLALICVRFLLVYSKKRYKTYRTFLCACLITVPLSFLLQTALINYVVNSSTDEDRNKAILITSAHGALVPFFGIGHWTEKFNISTKEKLVHPFLKPIAQWISHQQLLYRTGLLNSLAVTKPCALSIAQEIDATNGIDKAFFPYLSLINDIDESKYKEMIKAYQLCAYKDEGYFKDYSQGTFNHKILLSDMYYKKFSPAVDQYNTYKKYENNLREAKREADKQWRSGMDYMFGFKTTIKPKDSINYFYDHPDVRRIYEEKTGFKDLYPPDKDFKQKATKFLNENLPDSVIPAYLNKTGEPSEQYEQLTDDEIIEQGKKSYKAIIMPIIAMALSTLFLILNFILAIHSYLYRFLDRVWLKFRSVFLEHKKWTLLINIATNKRLMAIYQKPGVDPNETVAAILKRLMTACFWVPRTLIHKSFLILAFLWFLVLPLILSGGAYDELDNTKYKPVMKILYFNQSILIKAYDPLIAPANSATNHMINAIETFKERQRIKQQLEDVRIMEEMIENDRIIFDHTKN